MVHWNWIRSKKGRLGGGGAGGVTQTLQRSILGYIGTELDNKLGDFHEDDAGW